MKTIIFAAGGVVLVIGAVLGIYWLLWQLWCWVLPQVWATGPASLLRPNFWLFAAAWLLLSLIGRAMFGRAD